MNHQELRRYNLHEKVFDCLEAGDASGFVKNYGELYQGNPNEPWIHHIDGFMLSETGDQASAIPLLRLAVKGLPERIDPKISLGIALMKNAQNDEAENVLEQALAIEPDSFLALTNLACVLLTRVKNACPERAEEMLRRADKLTPDDASVWANLGHALAQQGKKTDAHATLLRAINLDKTGEVCRRIFLHYPELEEAVNSRLFFLDIIADLKWVKENGRPPTVNPESDKDASSR